MISEGLHDIPMADYLADPCGVPSLSAGCAFRLITQSPLHAWQAHPRLGAAPQDEASAADIGSVAHDLLLGGEGKLAIIDPADYPAKNGNIPDGWTNPAIRAARDDARQKGLTPILADRMEQVSIMVETAREFVARSQLAGIFANGKAERTIIWRDGESLARIRPDWLTHDFGVHLSYKTTTASARPEPFIRGLLNSSGYAFALRFYARGVSAHVGHYKTEHVILAQEQTAPFACSLIGLTPAKAMIEDDRVCAAFELWAQCMREGVWPAYSARIHYAEPSSWELAEAEARQADHDNERDGIAATLDFYRRAAE